jgi:hypothetical protein
MKDKEPVNEDLVRWTDHFWENPEKVLLLIDLISEVLTPSFPPKDSPSLNICLTSLWGRQ